MERGGREGRVYGPLFVKPCLVVIVEDLSMKKRNDHPCVNGPERALKRMEILMV